MVIRAAKPEDAYGIARVRVNSWRSTYRGIIPADYLLKLSSSVIEWAEKTNRALKKREVKGFVAVVEEEIVGFILYGEERSGKYPDHPNEVYAIYILEKHQGNGLGSMLLQRAIQTMSSQGILIWALEMNPYRVFYERKQGQIVDSKERAFGDLSLQEIAYGWPGVKEDSIVGA